MISSKVLPLRGKTSSTLRRSFSTTQKQWSPLSGSIIPPAKYEDFVVKNEPVYSYEHGTKERRVLESTLKQYSKDVVDVPIIIGGEEFRTKNPVYQVMPFNHKQKIAKYYYATPELLNKAIQVAVEAQKEWDRVPFDDKFKIWLKAADLMAGPWRPRLNSTTILGQGKTVIQAEIDAAAELIDFIRFNAFFAKDLLKYQPISENLKVTKNSLRYRGLEGFVAAVSPFNFTAIGGNLAYTPALMGSTVLWKPSDTAVLSNYTIYLIMREAGVPPGVINFVPADGPTFGDAITNSPHLAGINFTGSAATFKHLWKQVGSKIDTYRNFPRIVGECGGKNFHFIHPSANIKSVINCTIRSAFEYSGQKCSACSRMYVPQSIWPKVRDGLVESMKAIKVGDPQDFTVFMTSVIDEKAFDRIKTYIDYARKNLNIIHGGSYSKKEGYFIEPTLIETTNPNDKIMKDELFGPVLTVYPYPDNQITETLKLVDESTPFALTGAVFADDEEFVKKATEILKYSTGNFYINDRSTGSVVAQQPFGGSRMSGTNDKAGGPHYVLKWTSPQVIKETFIPYTEWVYPYMIKKE